MRLKNTNIKKAKNRSTSSSQWLRRHINDEYVIRAKSEGYRSRAAYKLQEIDDKFKLIKKNSKVIDLGAAPGGWCQILSQKINKDVEIIAIDLIEMDQVENVHLIQGDFCHEDTLKILHDNISGKIDLILSDMAPNTTGHKPTDHLKIMDLCERVIDFAKMVLREGGSIVVKIFQGGAQGDLLRRIKDNFRQVKHYKPASSRKNSSEMYLVAMGYKADNPNHVKDLALNN